MLRTRAVVSRAAPGSAVTSILRSSGRSNVTLSLHSPLYMVTRTKLTVAEREGLKGSDVHIFNGVNQTAIKEKQAPNRKETWAPSQRPRSDAMTGPLFDGVDLSTQPAPFAAIDLIAQTPVNYVHHTAVCDGNDHGIRGGVQGHPKVYINVEKPGIHACTYCGTRYADSHYREEIEAGTISKLHS